jgi:hypothetical protein
MKAMILGMIYGVIGLFLYDLVLVILATTINTGIKAPGFLLSSGLVFFITSIVSGCAIVNEEKTSK